MDSLRSCTLNRPVEFECLLGETLTSISGAHKGSEEIILETQDGRRWRMFHDRDCCETVEVEDVCGDISDLIGHPLTMAEEVYSNEYPVDSSHEGHDTDHMWTFYKLATAKGYVTIRWFGESNGFYSVKAQFEMIDPRG